VAPANDDEKRISKARDVETFHFFAKWALAFGKIAEWMA